MAPRSNGPFGPPGAPLRRRPAEDPFGAPSAQPAGQWPPANPPGYGEPQGYHFPPPEPQQGYGYSNPQLLSAQQWGPQGDHQAFPLNYQAYAPTDPGPFQQGAQHQHYGDPEVDYNDEFYEDEEPRRGRRWMLIAVALVGAIGVGGALAYTYRSLVAPHSGRVPLVKADTPRAKPEQRAERRAPPREETPPDPAPEESASENLGPRAVKTIPITGGGPPPAAPAPVVTAPVIPGITLYKPPEPPPSAAPPPPQVAPVVPQPPPRTVQPQSGRVVLGSRPPPSESAADEPPAAAPPPPPPPPARRPPPPVQTAAVPPRAPAPPPRAKESHSGLGYVAVLVTKKTSMDALKEFADMQQKYSDVLSDKTPDVQEADLTDRGLGVQYRLIVGPPGSRNAAQGVCAQLKSAGYVGCWVKEY